MYIYVGVMDTCMYIYVGFMFILLGVLSTRIPASADLGDILHFSRSAQVREAVCPNRVASHSVANFWENIEPF